MITTKEDIDDDVLVAAEDVVDVVVPRGRNNTTVEKWGTFNKRAGLPEAVAIGESSFPGVDDADIRNST